jgi:hypothetical protein
MKVLYVILILAAQAIVFDSRTIRGQTQGTSDTTAKPIVVGETLRLHSRRLGEERVIDVYLPPSYTRSKQRYPVIYALDGEGTGSVTANAMEFMTGYSLIPQMPEALIIGVANTNRNRDMPIPQEYGKGGEENLLAFLADELIPIIEQRYRTQPLRILLGHSQGGLFTHYALTARPTVFQWYLSIDAPLAGFPAANPIMEKVKTVIGAPPNYRGRLVTIENLYGWKKEWTSLIAAAPKTFYGEQVEIKDETHETMAYKAIYEGLKRLFHDYAPNIVKDTRGIYTLTTLEEMYQALSKDYGYQVDIPKQLLLASASRNSSMQYGAEAVELIKRAEALYGESPTTNRLMEDAKEAVKKGRDARLEEWMNLPPPNVEQMKPFLGAWGMIGPDGAQELMTLEVKDGVVRVQYTVTPSESASFQMEVQFVRVLEDKTLQWGLRNGRGAGIILRTAKLVNENTLEGTTEPVGIPHAPPPHSVTYQRRSNKARG